MDDSRMTSQEFDGTHFVIAEDAPIGVQLWPSRAPEFASNFTLAQVAVIRDRYKTVVRWTYENGRSETFFLGELVDVQLP